MNFLAVSFDLHRGIPILDPKALKSDFSTLQALLFPSPVFLPSFHSNSNDKLRITLNSQWKYLHALTPYGYAVESSAKENFQMKGREKT